jgi:hypothetical protein
MAGEWLRIPATRHKAAVERLRRSTLEGPGHTGAELRQAVAAYAAQLWRAEETRATIPDRLRPYVDKVVLSSYKVTDEDVADLRRAGLSEDEVLEITLAAALGCGLGALEVGMAAAGAEG